MSILTGLLLYVNDFLSVFNWKIFRLLLYLIIIISLTLAVLQRQARHSITEIKISPMNNDKR